MAEPTPTSTGPSLPQSQGEHAQAEPIPPLPPSGGQLPAASPAVDAGAEGEAPPPFRPRRSHRRFILLAVLVIVFDQITKVILRETLELGDREWLAEFFAFSHIANDGGAFGVFGGQNTVLAVSAVVAIGVVAIYYFFPPMNHWLVRSGLALILGGAIGNLLDRIYQGHVTDFIDFIHFPAFNVADAAINVGVAAIVIALLFGDLLKRNPRSPRSP
ncbi:MAG: signal peptidase II [Chloroflexi bacterium]|nr:signal peptidase II [Chloroflexota bacterium]MYJ57950.1 signal peptidase II [Chloroflexota bacterium]